MPYHTGSSKQENKKEMGKKPQKMKIFKEMPENAHIMDGNIVMSGKTHSSKSKVLGKLSKAKKESKKPKKGSKEMKEKMAKLRSMRK